MSGLRILGTASFDGTEAGWGRYTQSDPMGLRAGVNLYAYVGDNPVLSSDMLGLAHTPGGPYHPPDGTRIKCVKEDPCPALRYKIAEFSATLSSHVGWAMTHTDQHTVEIADLAAGLSNCFYIYLKNKCDGCNKPPQNDWLNRLEKNVGDWIEENQGKPFFGLPIGPPIPIWALGF